MSNRLRTAAAMLVLAGLCAAPASVYAQEIDLIPVPAAELSAGYTFMRDFEDDIGDLNFPAGWYVSGAVNLNRWFALVGEGTGSYKNDFDVEFDEFSAEENQLVAEMFSNRARVYTVMAGPRFFRTFGRFAPFGQFLIGAAHARLRTTGPPEFLDGGVMTETATDLALQPGGGLTVYLTERVGLRVSADYRSIIDFAGEEDTQYGKEFRIITGFTLNWGSR